jgi:hypothetical protein
MTDMQETSIQNLQEQVGANAQAPGSTTANPTATATKVPVAGSRKSSQVDRTFKFFLSYLTKILFLIDVTTPTDSTKAAAEIFAKAYALQIEKEQKQLMQFLNQQTAMVGLLYNLLDDSARTILVDNVQIQRADTQLSQTAYRFACTNQSLSSEYPTRIFGTRAAAATVFEQAYMPENGRTMTLRLSDPINVDVSTIPSIVTLFTQLQAKLDNKITDLNVTLTGAPLYQKALLAARIGHQGFFNLEAKVLNAIPSLTMYRVIKSLMGVIAIETNYQLPIHKRWNIQTSPRVANSYSSEPVLRRAQIPGFELEVYWISLSDWAGFMTDTYYFPGNPAAHIPPFTKDDFNTFFSSADMLHIDSSRLDATMLKLLVTNFIMDTTRYRFIERTALSPANRRSTVQSRLFMDGWLTPIERIANPSVVLLIDVATDNPPNWLSDMTDMYRTQNPADRYDQYFVDANEQTWTQATGITRMNAAEYYRRFSFLYPTATALALEFLSTTTYGTTYQQMIRNADDQHQDSIAPAIMMRKPPDTGADPPLNQYANLKYMYATQMPLVNTTQSQQDYAGVNYDTVFSCLYTPCYGLTDGTLLPFAEDQGINTGGIPIPRDGVFSFLWDIVFPMLGSQNEMLVKGLTIQSPTDFLSSAYTKSFINITSLDYMQANTFMPAPVIAFDQLAFPAYGNNVTPNSSRDLMSMVQSIIPFKPFAYDIVNYKDEDTIIEEMFLKLAARQETTLQILVGPITYDQNLQSAPTHRYNCFAAKRRYFGPELYMDYQIMTAADAFAPITVPETRPTDLLSELDMRAFYQMSAGPDLGYVNNDVNATNTRYVSFNTAALPVVAKKHISMLRDPTFAVALPAVFGQPVTIIAMNFTNVETAPLATQLQFDLRCSSTFQDTSLRVRLYMQFLRYNRVPQFESIAWPRAYLIMPGVVIGLVAQDMDGRQPNEALINKKAALKSLKFRD